MSNRLCHFLFLAAFVVFARVQACVSEAGQSLCSCAGTGVFGLLRRGEILWLRACHISLTNSWMFAPADAGLSKTGVT